MPKTNPDTIIESLEKVCKRFNVKLDVNRYTGCIIVFDKDGMEVCNFDSLTFHDGPTNLEIGASYETAYSTK